MVIQLTRSAFALGRQFVGNLCRSRNRSFSTTVVTRKSGKESPRVLITGGSGNLGTKAAQRMVQCGAEVHVLDPWAPAAPVENVHYHAHDMVALHEWYDCQSHVVLVFPYRLVCSARQIFRYMRTANNPGFACAASTYGML